MRGLADRCAPWGSSALLAGLFALIVAAGCGGSPENTEDEDGVGGDHGQLSRSALLFFANSDGRRMEGEKREIYPADPTREAVVRSLLRELAGGPVRNGLHPVVPPTLEVASVFFDDMGGLFISFSGASIASRQWGSASELGFVKSVIRTVGSSFPEVMRITFLVDGERVESIAGHVETIHPFEVAEWR